MRHGSGERHPGTGRPNSRPPGDRGDSAEEQARAAGLARDGEHEKAGGPSVTGHHAPDASDAKVPRGTMDLTRVTLSDDSRRARDE